VGKSSLISTFVSRYFSEVVPGIMTRVRLPPDPQLSSCITTIVDSQGGDVALLQAAVSRGVGMRRSSEGSLQALLERAQASSSETGAAAATAAASSPPTSEPPPPPPPPSSSSGGYDAIDNVDSIVLVYDLDRVETFFRLENHWLPLIEHCYGGKVSVYLPFQRTNTLCFSSSRFLEFYVLCRITQ
jgi:Ras family protein T1